MSFERWADEVRTALAEFGHASIEFSEVTRRVAVESGGTVILHWRRKCSCCADPNASLVLEQFPDIESTRFERSRQETKPVHSAHMGSWLELG